MPRPKSIPELLVESLERIDGRLASIDKKLGAIMTQQDDLNLDIATLTTALGQVETDVTALTTYIASLVAGEQTLDLSQLDTLAQGANATVAGLTALVPAPAPTPTTPTA